MNIIYNILTTICGDYISAVHNKQGLGIVHAPIYVIWWFIWEYEAYLDLVIEPTQWTISFGFHTWCTLYYFVMFSTYLDFIGKLKWTQNWVINNNFS